MKKWFLTTSFLLLGSVFVAAQTTVLSVNSSGNVTSTGSITSNSGGLISSSGTGAGTLQLSQGSAPTAPAMTNRR